MKLCICFNNSSALSIAAIIGSIGSVLRPETLLAHLVLSEICRHFSDAAYPPSLRAQIEDRTAAATRGAVWTPADFLDLGSRDAVDKALQRLVADDLLRRIDRGLYHKPTRNALTKKSNPKPSQSKRAAASATQRYRRWFRSRLPAGSLIG